MPRSPTAQRVVSPHYRLFGYAWLHSSFKTRYHIADSMVDINSASASVE